MSTDKVAMNGAAPGASAVARPAEAAVKPTPVERPKAPPAPSSEETLQAIAKRLESWVRSSSRSLEFSVDEGSGRTVISVRDAESGELIRQIPNEEALRMSRALREGAGSLLDLTV